MPPFLQRSPEFIDPLYAPCDINRPNASKVGKRELELRREWELNYAALLKFRSDNGHIKLKSCKGPNKRLFYWLTRMRQLRQHKKLDEWHTQRLVAIGFKWENPPPRSSWEERFLQLKKYIKKYGDSHVPQASEKEVEEEFRGLWKWVSRQRTNKRTGSILKEHEDSLNGIGFSWSTIHNSYWDKRYEKLLKYYKKHGHINMTRGGTKDEIDIFDWIYRQRLRYHEGKLAKYREEKLNSLGMEWGTINKMVKVNNGKKTGDDQDDDTSVVDSDEGPDEDIENSSDDDEQIVAADVVKSKKLKSKSSGKRTRKQSTSKKESDDESNVDQTENQNDEESDDEDMEEQENDEDEVDDDEEENSDARKTPKSLRSKMKQSPKSVLSSSIKRSKQRK